MNQRMLDHHLRPPIETISANDVLCGDIEGSGNYIIHGAVIGEGRVVGTVFLSETAYWKGDIQADIVVVKGRVDGSVSATTKVELRNSAVVPGDVQAPIVAMAMRARVGGRLPDEGLLTRFTERRTPALLRA